MRVSSFIYIKNVHTTYQMFLQFAPFYVWDSIILLLLLLGVSVSAGTVIFLNTKIVHKYCRPLYITFGMFTFFCTAVLTYASFIEPYRLTVTTKVIETKLLEPLNVVVISDLHLRPGKDSTYLQKVVQTIQTLSPDLILILGDFVFNPSTSFESLLELQNLHPTIGTYAVLGNHDQGLYTYITGESYSKTTDEQGITDTLEQANVQVLRNQIRNIEYGRNRITIAGIDDLWSYKSSLKTVIEQMPTTNTYSILLSHNPSIITDDTINEFHLVVSGHTHGGQVRLPLIGPIVSLPTTLGDHYDKGIFTVAQNTVLAITSGLGESGARVRLFAPPEILLLHLR